MASCVGRWSTSFPTLFTTTRRMPSVPCSRSLYWRSRPDLPTKSPGRKRPLLASICCSLTSPTYPLACAIKPPGRIAAAVHHQHFQHRNVCAVRVDKRDVRLAGFRLDDDGLKIFEVAGILQLLPQVLHRNAQPFGDRRKILFHLRRVIAQQEHAERGIVVHQDVAVAI